MFSRSSHSNSPAEGSANASDRRMSARSPLFMLVHLDGLKDQAGQAASPQCWAWDIGLGGMQVRARRNLFPGTFVNLRFTLPGSDEELKVGGQITSIDQGPDGGLSHGIKFCRPSRALRMTIYRFLDKRRQLWQSEIAPAVDAPKKTAKAVRGLPFVELEPVSASSDRPFEGLLREAFHSLQAKEMGRVDALQSHPSRDLWILAKILGQKVQGQVAHWTTRLAS